MDGWSKPLMLEGDTQLERTVSLIHQQLYSDFEIKVDSLTGNVTTYYVHKCILAIVSPVWERNIQWARGTNCMKITGFPLDVISCLLIYAYTNIVKFHSLEFCLEVIIAADYFCIRNIINDCVRYIKILFSNTDLGLDDLVLIFNVASLHRVRGLIELCIAYIEDNPDLVLSSYEFNNLTIESLKYILHLNCYLFPESKFISSILSWCLSQTTADGLRKFLSENEIIGVFRFRILSVDDLRNIFQNYPTVFTKNEQLEMMKSIVENKPFLFDYISSDNFDRGGFNFINDEQIIVRTPPLVIAEQFFYVEGDSLFPIISVEIEPRNNSYFSSFNRRYEESITLQIAGHTVNYDEVLDLRNGPTLSIPYEIYILPKHVFKIHITLKKPGIYRKNNNFATPRKGMIREKNGLVQSINNFGKNFINLR